VLAGSSSAELEDFVGINSNFNGSGHNNNNNNDRLTAFDPGQPG